MDTVDSATIWDGIRGKISEMRYNNMLCDVVLESESSSCDHFAISAHSVVLAASSTFFHNHFLNTTLSPGTPHAFCLTNIPSDVLVTTVNFMYGEMPQSVDELMLLENGAAVFGIDSAQLMIEKSKELLQLDVDFSKESDGDGAVELSTMGQHVIEMTPVTSDQSSADDVNETTEQPMELSLKTSPERCGTEDRLHDQQSRLDEALHDEQIVQDRRSDDDEGVLSGRQLDNQEDVQEERLDDQEGILDTAIQVKAECDGAGEEADDDLEDVDDGMMGQQVVTVDNEHAEIRVFKQEVDIDTEAGCNEVLLVDDEELDNMMMAPKQDNGTIELTEEQLEQLVQQSKMQDNTSAMFMFNGDPSNTDQNSGTTQDNVVATHHAKPTSSRLPASFMHQSLVCTHCQNTAMLFNTITELVKHMKMMHPLAAYYACCLCFRMFKYQSAIVKHFRVAHTIDSTYKCLKRCHALVMPLNCDSHMFLVNDIPKESHHKNICPCCQEAHLSMSDLQAHFWTHVEEVKPVMSNEIDLLECHVCAKHFDSQQLLKKHVSWEHDFRLKCKDCGQIFGTTETLKIHRRTHTKAKDYICDICGKAFRQKHHLTEHKEIHSNEYKYRCPHCPKKFKFSQAMKRHYKVVHDASFVRPYECDKCPYTASERQHLILHMRKHTGERPHKCVLCYKRFIQESHLQRHFIYHAKRGEMTPDGVVLTPDGDIVNSDHVTSEQVTSVLEDGALDSIEAIINDNTDMNTDMDT